MVWFWDVVENEVVDGEWNLVFEVSNEVVWVFNFKGWEEMVFKMNRGKNLNVLIRILVKRNWGRIKEVCVDIEWFMVVKVV